MTERSEHLTSKEIFDIAERCTLNPATVSDLINNGWTYVETPVGKRWVRLYDAGV